MERPIPERSTLLITDSSVPGEYALYLTYREYRVFQNVAQSLRHQILHPYVRVMRLSLIHI